MVWNENKLVGLHTHETALPKDKDVCKSLHKSLLNEALPRGSVLLPYFNKTNCEAHQNLSRVIYS